MELKDVPSIDAVLPHIREPYIHPAKVRIARKAVSCLRSRIVIGQSIDENELIRILADQSIHNYRRVINATGILLHTNLGRAPIGRKILADLAREQSGYCDLEFEGGQRSDRMRVTERLLCLLTGAEAALVVNNNAAALLLISHLFKGREVVVSRGEIIEIGGGFRIHEILESAGAKVVEVGTTNITTLSDFENSLTAQTGFVLRINPSNFSMKGHCSSVSLNRLGQLCRKRNVPLVFDQGCGWEWSNKNENSAEKLLTEVDCLCFSGDKLLGGPQAGIVLGKSEFIRELKQSSVYRALRLGKLDLFVLNAVLEEKLRGFKSPTDRMLVRSVSMIRKRARAIVKKIPGAQIVKGKSVVGGGVGERELDTVLISIPCDESHVARRLESGDHPIVVRKQKGAIQIDLRTVSKKDDPVIIKKLEGVLCLS